MDSCRRGHPACTTIQRSAREHHDFKSPFHTATVGRIDGGGAFRIESVQPRDQGWQFQGGKFLAEIRVAGRQFVKTPKKSLQVKTCAADNNGPIAACTDGLQYFQRIATIARRIIGFTGIDTPDEMMGYLGSLLECRLCRENREPHVNLEGIGSDDLPPEALRQQEGEGGFAGPCGTGKNNRFRGNHGNKSE